MKTSFATTTCVASASSAVSSTATAMRDFADDAFLKRLKVRGVRVNVGLRNALVNLLMEHHTSTLATDTPPSPVAVPHARPAEHSVSTRSLTKDAPVPLAETFWLSLSEDAYRSLRVYENAVGHTAANTNTLPGILAVHEYCYLLSPLRVYNIHYINVAILMVYMTCAEIRNLYRYLYLEWMRCRERDDATTTSSALENECDADHHTPWILTPRAFCQLRTDEMVKAWRSLLQRLVGVPGTQTSTHTSTHFTTCMFFVNRLRAYLTPLG